MLELKAKTNTYKSKKIFNFIIKQMYVIHVSQLIVHMITVHSTNSFLCLSIDISIIEHFYLCNTDVIIKIKN